MSVKSYADLPDGTIGFAPVSGATGGLIALGQTLLGEDCIYRHVFVKVGNYAVEAMPGGALSSRVNPGERWSKAFAYAVPTYAAGQGDRVAMYAVNMVGTPYGFADYLALALKHRHLSFGLLNGYISATKPNGLPKRAICSQLADAALSLAGWHVFNDGCLPQDVTPGGLYYALIEDQNVSWVWPGH